MPAKDLIFFKYQTLFLSLLRPVLCAFERQPIKNPEVAVWYTVHVHQAALQFLYSGHSLLHADGPFPSTQAVPSSLQSHVSQYQTLFVHIMQKTAF